jgi:signal transduction histidine kinase
MAKVRRASEQMGRLIDDLLNFSRMGRAPMQEEVVALNRLLAEVRREIEPEARGRSIEWVVGALPAVRADSAMVKQVLTNLLSNAVKYTRPRQEARIEVGSETVNGEVLVHVTDNGVGFDERYASKLFGVFQRLHRQDEFEGTGIGLANVRRVVLRHGGRVWARGELNKGATFSFTLPRA